MYRAPVVTVPVVTAVNDLSGDGTGKQVEVITKVMGLHERLYFWGMLRDASAHGVASRGTDSASSSSLVVSDQANWPVIAGAET